MTEPKTFPDEIIAVGFRDAVKMIGLCENTLRSLIAHGEVKSVKIGGKRLILVSSLRKLVCPDPDQVAN